VEEDGMERRGEDKVGQRAGARVVRAILIEFGVVWRTRLSGKALNESTSDRWGKSLRTV